VLDPPGSTEKQYYYRARYLAPAIGRFISEDPIIRGVGTYFYASNDRKAFGSPVATRLAFCIDLLA
jgi:RHS repeat-associated protein